MLAVAEALLYGAKATVAGAAKATGLSAGSCTNALRLLTEQDLLVADAPRGRLSARRVSDDDRLLRAYADAVAATEPGVEVRAGVVWRDLVSGLASAGRRWEAEGWAWACTGAIAASVLAPYMTTVGTAMVYVSAETIGELEAVLRAADLDAMEGGRLLLRPFPTVTTRSLGTDHDGLHIAPWPRVYADLRLARVRGEEAAEHLREAMGDG